MFCNELPNNSHYSSPFLLPQGPEFDEEEESDLTVTELRERTRKQKAELERRMMGDGSDDDDEKEEEERREQGREGESNKSRSKLSNEDSGCSWGIGELFGGLCRSMLCVICVDLVLCCHTECVGVNFP